MAKKKHVSIATDWVGSSLAGLSSDTARCGGTSAGQGLGALRGLGGGAFGGAAAEDDLIGNVMSNVAGLNDGSDELGSNGSSLFGSSAEASSLLGSRPSASSSLLGAAGSIGPTGDDLLSNMSQSGGFHHRLLRQASHLRLLRKIASSV